ncbi:MAG: hypothetical protein PSN04_03425 [Methyloprofundus sp.]|nr:hypothetical protein [Methyloprofundus sp.]
MTKLDRVKEEIGAIKSYLGFVIAFIITIGAGLIKIYLDNSSDFLLLLGVLSIVILAVIFAFLAKIMHQKICELEDI